MKPVRTSDVRRKLQPGRSNKRRKQLLRPMLISSKLFKSRRNEK